MRINGTEVQDVSEVPDLIQQSKGRKTTLVVRHKGDAEATALPSVRPRSEPKLSVPQATGVSV